MPPVSSFRRRHFTLKHQIIAFLSENLFRNLTYTVRHGLIRGMKRKGGLGFLPAALISREQNEAELNFLQNLDLNDKIVYDIGAFQGVMTLFFARKAKAVVTYEAHPANFKRLIENVHLNRLQNVTAFNRGIGECRSTVMLACDPLMPGAASGDAGIVAQLRASLPEAEVVQVEVFPLDEEIEQHGLPAPNLVKMDIEGMELSALKGMKRLLAARHPQLYLEMHGATESDKEEKAAALLDFLTRAGYKSILHVETGKTITPSEISTARSGHLYCSVKD